MRRFAMQPSTSCSDASCFAAASSCARFELSVLDMVILAVSIFVCLVLRISICLILAGLLALIIEKSNTQKAYGASETPDFR